MKLIMSKNKSFLRNINKLRRFSKWRPNLSYCSSFSFSLNNNNKDYSFYRKWLYLNENFTRKPSDLRIMSYNILADSYAYDYLFPACSKEEKAFDFRSKLLKKLVISF